MCLWELARNPEAQSKLIHEIESLAKTKSLKSIVNDLQCLEYLEMFINETSRKNPTTSLVSRTCNQDCSLTTSDGELFKFLKGDLIQIPIKLIQNDETYFNKPQNFDPIRFANNESNGKFLSFGLGQRKCLGKRYTMLLIKAFIVTLLLEFSVEILNNSNVISKNDRKLIFVQRFCDTSVQK
jgi:cytochrome P450